MIEVVYPELVWTPDKYSDRIEHAKPLGHEIRITHIIDDHPHHEYPGWFTVIFDHSAIQTGEGEHGYYFKTQEDAYEAARVALHTAIDKQVAHAVKILEMYVQ